MNDDSLKWYVVPVGAVLPTGGLIYKGVVVCHRSWWVRLLECLHLRQRVYNVTHQFEVLP
jgi:hypothetical protein